MPEAVTAESIAEAATAPASASVDGVNVAAVPISQQIEALRLQQAADSLSGTNANGGPKSGWNALRTSKAVPPGAV